MSNTIELFETIKHDLASVKQMRKLCDAYLCSLELDENYPYFKKQLDTRIAEYKQTYRRHSIISPPLFFSLLRKEKEGVG